ncbi:hypothetical protein Ahy_B03g062202 isoform B [Arachis hypogaea]|uniref:Uncharacterized protein n=1 Tax=Arachis hypogaea TaxID=3818 RepID=A0A444ZTR4_ARAHY|nr:hypothetical protein Ahy_B03g062202 isoform B [Arachis hypogaea]
MKESNKIQDDHQFLSFLLVGALILLAFCSMRLRDLVFNSTTTWCCSSSQRLLKLHGVGQGLISSIQLHKHPIRLLLHGRIMAHIWMVLKRHGSISSLDLIHGCTLWTNTQNLVEVALTLHLCGSA